MSGDFSKKAQADLYEINVRGALAGMFLARGVTPEPEQWAMLKGTREITLRDIGEIAWALSFDVQFDLVGRIPGENP